jgi:hypothetical protein
VHGSVFAIHPIPSVKQLDKYASHSESVVAVTFYVHVLLIQLEGDVDAVVSIHVLNPSVS